MLGICVPLRPCFYKPLAVFKRNVGMIFIFQTNFYICFIMPTKISNKRTGKLDIRIKNKIIRIPISTTWKIRFLCMGSVKNLTSTTSLFLRGPMYNTVFLTSQTIWQSEIVNWLNEKKLPLERVQLMAGLRWISSTLRYSQNPMEERR